MWRSRSSRRMRVRSANSIVRVPGCGPEHVGQSRCSRRWGDDLTAGPVRACSAHRRSTPVPAARARARLSCNLDYIAPAVTSTLRFSINVGTPGTKQISASTTMAVRRPEPGEQLRHLFVHGRSAGADSAADSAANCRRQTQEPHQGRRRRPACAPWWVGARLAARQWRQRPSLRWLGQRPPLRKCRQRPPRGRQGRATSSTAVTGKDTILARDKAIDTIRCGAGNDIVTADRNDKVAKDCETVRRGLGRPSRRVDGVDCAGSIPSRKTRTRFRKVVKAASGAV